MGIVKSKASPPWVQPPRGHSSWLSGHPGQPQVVEEPYPPLPPATGFTLAAQEAEIPPTCHSRRKSKSRRVAEEEARDQQGQTQMKTKTQRQTQLQGQWQRQAEIVEGRGRNSSLSFLYLQGFTHRIHPSMWTLLPETEVAPQKRQRQKKPHNRKRNRNKVSPAVEMERRFHSRDTEIEKRPCSRNRDEVP